MVLLYLFILYFYILKILILLLFNSSLFDDGFLWFGLLSTNDPFAFYSNFRGEGIETI